eukprot:1191642-Prorocentrum_minimum.AAC.2
MFERVLTFSASLNFRGELKFPVVEWLNKGLMAVWSPTRNTPASESSRIGGPMSSLKASLRLRPFSVQMRGCRCLSSSFRAVASGCTDFASSPHARCSTGCRAANKIK